MKIPLANCHHTFFLSHTSIHFLSGSIKKFRSNKVREISLLRALKKFTSNLKDLDRKEQTELNKDFSTQAYTKALLSLPHNALAFYVHAYSSLVWNQAASYRLSQLGRNVIAGDLVEIDESTEVRIKIFKLFQFQKTCFHQLILKSIIITRVVI